MSETPELNKQIQRCIECPHCGEQIIIEFTSTVSRIMTGDFTDAGRTAKWEESLNGTQKALLDSVTRSGLLDSFRFAVESGPHNGVPRNMRKYFLEWVKHAKAVQIPAWALNEFGALYKGRIEFHVQQYVGGVVSDGVLQLFVPVNLVRASKTRIGDVEPDVQGIRQWIKTKNSYIPPEAKLFVQELRSKTFGAFAIPELPRK